MNAIWSAAAASGPLAAGWATHSWWIRQRLNAARRDPLTGLPRRDALEAHARKLLLRHGTAAVLLIDLDDFKPINDHFGHAAGDTVLRTFGSRLTAWADTTGGVAGRLGGDEFAAVAPCDSAAFLPDGLEVLHHHLCGPVTHDGQHLTVGASIGAAWRDGHTPDLSVLLRLADESMYAAKRAGGGWCIADNLVPTQPTINGRRRGRPGTSEGDQS